MFLRSFVPKPSADAVQTFAGIERGVAKYSDAGHVKGFISETVQDMALGTIND